MHDLSEIHQAGTGYPLCTGSVDRVLLTLYYRGDFGADQAGLSGAPQATVFGSEWNDLNGNKIITDCEEMLLMKIHAKENDVS